MQDVLWTHILSLLPIQTRVALGVPPGRLDVAAYEAMFVPVMADKAERIRSRRGAAYCVTCWDTYQGAGWYGHITCMKRMLENGDLPDDSGLCNAVMNDKLESVRWMLSVSRPCVPYACWTAAYNGNVAMIKLLRDAGYPWGDEPWDRILWDRIEGNPDMLTWLKENGCPYAP